MPYSAQIDRTHPACILFLVDQSRSMSKPFGAQPNKAKAVGVADAINKLLQTLCLKCAKADGVREYFDIGVIGYGKQVGPALSGDLSGRGLISIADIAAHPLRIETRTKLIDDGAGGTFKQNLKFPVWFEPVAEGSTPMADAFGLARTWIMEFLKKHPDSYPPLVINLTDGVSDADPTEAAESIMRLGSKDGGVLLFNGHMSARRDPPVMFAEQEQGLPNDFAKQLFRMSSQLPERLVEAARRENFPAGPNSRGFIFNADLVALIQFLDIGTRMGTRGNGP